MKGLKEFLELLEDDQDLMAELENIENNDTAKVVEIAKKHGYEFTEDEFNDFLMEAVSGGGKIGDWFKKTAKKAENAFKKAGNAIKEDFEDTVADVAFGLAVDHPEIVKKFIKF